MTASERHISDAQQAHAAFRLLDRPITPDELAENTAQIGRALDAEARHPASAVICLIGEEQLAIRSTVVARVHDMVPVHRVPHRSNDTVLGLCNIDGQLVLCASLANLLQIPQDRPPVPGPAENQATAEARLITIGAAPEQWAFPVDAVCGVAGFDPETLQPLPLTVGQSLSHFSTGIIHVEGGQATLLDTEIVLKGFQSALK